MITVEQLAALHAHRDELYQLSDSARDAQDYPTSARYHAMACGITTAIRVLQNLG